jgi:myosin heavy subunit
MIFAITTLISALSISLIAAYFSIIGLATIFPGSMYAVIAMGSVLEVGKIIASIWLHRNWKSAPRLIKFYLFSAILVLMGITSMGIFGFLSKSHIEHEQTAEKSRAMVLQVENKIERQKDYINRQKDLIEDGQKKNENLGDKTAENIKLEQEKIKQLTDQLSRDISIDNDIIQSLNSRLLILDNQLNEIKNKSGGLFSSKKKDIQIKIEEQKEERTSISEKINIAELRVAKHRDETSKIISKVRDRIQEYQSLGFEKPENTASKVETLNQNISKALSEIDKLEQEKFNYGDGTRQLEAEIGPIKYVAEFISDFTGTSFDISKAVRIVILILIFVFDPLAILLVLAAHISLSKKFPNIVIDEESYIKKTSELEIKEREIVSKELELTERQKDIEENSKIIKLHENQIEAYQKEISNNKDVARSIKLETEKNIIELEKNSPVKQEIDNLMKRKKEELIKLESLKKEKSEILTKLDKFDEDCKEIKSVFTKHGENKSKIEKLKQSLDISIKQLSLLKNLNKEVESENLKLKKDCVNSSKLISEIDSLKKENQITKAQHSQCSDFAQQVKDLKKQRDKLLSQKSQTQQGSLIIKSNLGNGSFSVEVASDIGGCHLFTKVGDFNKAEMLNCQAIASEIDEICPERKGPLLSKVFDSNIKKYLDNRLDNREYKKSRPEYKFIS